MYYNFIDDDVINNHYTIYNSDNISGTKYMNLLMLMKITMSRRK